MRRNGKNTERREFYALVDELIMNTVRSTSSIPIRPFNNMTIRHMFGEAAAQELCSEMKRNAWPANHDALICSEDADRMKLRTQWLQNKCPDRKLSTLQWQKIIECVAQRCADQIAADIKHELTTMPPITPNDIVSYSNPPFSSNSAALKHAADGQADDRLPEILAQTMAEALSKVIVGNSDYTVHRPGSETSHRFKDPTNAAALQAQQEEKRDGKVTKVNDRTNDPNAKADIKLVADHGKDDELTGKAPFEDNEGVRRSNVKDDFIYRGKGDMRQTFEEAVWFDGLYTRSLKSVSGVAIQEESRQFLLKSVLPKLTKHQGQLLAKAFMHNDEGGVERILELVKRNLPYMTLRKSA